MALRFDLLEKERDRFLDKLEYDMDQFFCDRQTGREGYECPFCNAYANNVGCLPQHPIKHKDDCVRTALVAFLKGGKEIRESEPHRPPRFLVRARKFLEGISIVNASRRAGVEELLANLMDTAYQEGMREERGDYAHLEEVGKPRVTSI